MTKVLFTVKETAILLFGHHSPATQKRVYRFIETGKLHVVKDGRKNWISKSELSKHGVINFEFEKIPKPFESPPAIPASSNQKIEQKSRNGAISMSKSKDSKRNSSRELLLENQRQYFENVSKLKMNGAKGELAHYCGVKRESVSRWIHGKLRVKETYLPKIFEWVGHGSYDEIWGGWPSQVQKQSASLQNTRDVTEESVIQTFQKEMKERFGYSEVKIKLLREID